jgi:hypothetical protein
MPNAQALASWNKRLDFEGSLSELSRRTLGGSPTARSLAEGADAMSLGADAALHILGGSAILPLLMRGGRDLIGSRMGKGTDAAIRKVAAAAGHIVRPAKNTRAGHRPRCRYRGVSDQAPGSGRTTGIAASHSKLAAPGC